MAPVSNLHVLKGNLQNQWIRGDGLLRGMCHQAGHGNSAQLEVKGQAIHPHGCQHTASLAVAEERRTELSKGVKRVWGFSNAYSRWLWVGSAICSSVLIKVVQDHGLELKKI